MTDNQEVQPDKIKRKIYNRIKVQLALHQMKNKELAEHLGVSVQTVSKWATNYSQPSIPELYEIAVLLNIPVDKLLEPDPIQKTSEK